MTRWQSTIDSSESYDEVKYRESLRTLGLFAPVTKEDIQKAYRSRAKEYHPDQFFDNGEKEKATERIQEVNAAHEYALKNFNWFDISQSRAASYKRKVVHPESSMGRMQRWVVAPVAVLYSLALLIAGVPGILGRLITGSLRISWWHASQLAEFRGSLWRGWLGLGPHLLALVLFALTDVTILKAWFGVSFLVMLATDVASKTTGEDNPLRDHPILVRVKTFVYDL